MRCWTLPHGRLLAEEQEGHYHVMTPDGRLERSFLSGGSSEREHLYETTYFVEGKELRCRFSDDNWDLDNEPPTVTISVDLRGLVPTTHPGIAGLVKAALAAQEAQATQAAQREKDLLAAFERDLPDFKGTRKLDFIFAYDADEAIVVTGPGGVRVWREIGYPYHGRSRFEDLEEILRRRYKKRLRSFEPDLPDMKTGMAFNPE